MSKKPQDSNFRQQRMPAWQPLLLPKPVIIAFTIIGILFIAIGAIVLATDGGVVEVRESYHDKCSIGQSDCSVTLKVTEEITGDVFLYYELDNFYQNHRRYVKSRDDKMLRGEESAVVSADCEPFATLPEDVFNPLNTSEQVAEKGQTIYPCGLIAASYFNDSFTVDASFELNRNDISWETDRTNKFKSSSSYKTGLGETYSRYLPDGRRLPEVTDEALIVWMRTAGLSNFRKLYGKIKGPVAPGDFVVTVSNLYPVSSFEGSKFLVLSNTSALGGSNGFLGTAYIVVGVICLLLAGAFLATCKSRKFADENLIQ